MLVEPLHFSILYSNTTRYIQWHAIANSSWFQGRFSSNTSNVHVCLVSKVFFFSISNCTLHTYSCGRLLLLFTLLCSGRRASTKKCIGITSNAMLCFCYSFFFHISGAAYKNEWIWSKYNQFLLSYSIELFSKVFRSLNIFLVFIFVSEGLVN